MLCGRNQSSIISLPLYQRRKTTIGRADPAAVPVDHEVAPDHRLYHLDGEALGINAVVEQLALHPSPHAFAACIVVT